MGFALLVTLPLVFVGTVVSICASFVVMLCIKKARCSYRMKYLILMGGISYQSSPAPLIVYDTKSMSWRYIVGIVRIWFAVSVC